MHRALSRVTLAVLAFAALGAPAFADTLYQAAPPPVGPGHPLRLGPDFRAGQVGDLVTVVFNFSQANSQSMQQSVNNSYSLSATPGQGLANIFLLKDGIGLGATRQSSEARAQVGSSTFTSTMEAQVTDVLPSGALKIAGDQNLLINGQKQVLHITGVIRPQDIDNTDTIASSNVANVQAEFKGDADKKTQGILQKIVNFLF
ncbi:MAG TPA: flagellar basal body L-ring protein FlgH [Candidatus Sulfotelmatobacter sp.]|nr:flagellar basal body L-ring protein FlgH [Candidatus Sulfotelmatobacter sp.]